MPTGVYKRIPAYRRFLTKIKKLDSCWEWIGAIGTHGYGRFGLKNKTIQAHRYSFELFNSRIPLDMWVLHSCDNRKCVNPEHLFLGDRDLNIKDCIDKRRHAFGESHAMSKLSDQDIIKIRNLYSSGIHTQQQLADEFKTTNSNISQIINHKSRRIYGQSPSPN